MVLAERANIVAGARLESWEASMMITRGRAKFKLSGLVGLPIPEPMTHDATRDGRPRECVIKTRLGWTVVRSRGAQTPHIWISVVRSDVFTFSLSRGHE